VGTLRSRFGSWSRRALGPALVLFLVVSLVAGIPGAAGAQGWGRVKNMDKFVRKIGETVGKQSDLRFKDLEDALWAASAVAKMRGLGIVNGYEGNVFLPNNPVKQAEAFAMMARAFGLEDEARQLAEKFGLPYQSFDKIKGDKPGRGAGASEGEGEEAAEEAFTVEGQVLPYVPVPSRWALGYVLLAVDQGWVKLSECFPEKPAARAWISMVMVRALEHEPQALSRMNAVLPFTDAAVVPADSVGYVAEAVAMGLFTGYEDNTFQPNKPVTRAEMATILDRFIGQELPAGTPYIAVGTVQSVSQSALSLKTASGSALIYTISADALILIGRVPGTASDIRVGDLAEVLSNGNGAALLITVKGRSVPPAAPNEVTGDIVAISTPAGITLRIDGQPNRTIILAANCRITIGAATAGFADLLLGDRVRVTVQDNRATSIAVLARGQSTQTVTGVVYGITVTSAGTDITVKQASSQVTLRLAQDVRITYGSATLSSSDLRTGDQIEATVQSHEVTLIRITARDVAVPFGDFGGSIVSITQTATDTVIVVDDAGTRRTVKVLPGTLITFGSTILSRSALRLGDVLRVRMSGDSAVEIRISVRGS